ncbi:MAG: hypothetical protein WBB23_24350 [Desulforhopalus sp.]
MSTKPITAGEEVILLGLSEYGNSVLEQVGRDNTVSMYRSDACIYGENVPAYRVESKEGESRWIKRYNDPNFKILLPKKIETE